MDPFAVLWSEVSAAGSSKRRVTDAGDEDTSTSAHKVGSTVDLLSEILLRLPLTSLRVCRLVCKHWLSLITDRDFNQLLRNRNPNFKRSSGLILQLQSASSVFAFVPFNPRNPVKRSPVITSFPFYPNSGSGGYIKVLQSCNGLLLCHAWPDKFYVYNPTVTMSKLLPLPHVWEPNRFVLGMAIAFDPQVSPHYKVVYPRDDCPAPGAPNRIEIHIYSSETGNWRACAQTFSLTSFAAFEGVVYWNNAIHWIDYAHEVCHFNLDMDDLGFIKVETPRRSLNHDGKLLVSADRLLLLQMFEHPFRRHEQIIDVYEMKNGRYGWFIKCRVNLAMAGRLSFQPRPFTILSVFLGKREEEKDPVMLLEESGKLIQYNIISKTFHELCDLTRTSPLDAKSCSFLFTKSLAGV